MGTKWSFAAHLGQLGHFVIPQAGASGWFLYGALVLGQIVRFILDGKT